MQAPSMAMMAPAQQEMVHAPPAVRPDDVNVLSSYQPLEEKKIDVTDYCKSTTQCVFCPCCGWLEERLIFTDTQLIYRKRDSCFIKRKRRAYSEMGYYEKVMICGGACNKFASDLTGENPMAKKPEDIPGLSPGCFGEERIVDEIISVLKDRREKRGGLAQMRKLDRVVEKLQKLNLQLAGVLAKENVAYPRVPLESALREMHEPLSLDMTNNIEMLCCTTKHLDLRQDEVGLRIEMCCNSRDIKREYNDMDSVEKNKRCGCCYSFSSALGGGMEIAPGCPCANRAKVTKAVSELRKRLSTRGQTGQMRRQEKMLRLISSLEGLLEAALKELPGPGAEAGSQFYPPSQMVMQGHVGGNAGEDPATLDKLRLQVLPELPPIDVTKLSPVFEDADFDVTNKCESLCTCCFTCGMAGMGTEKLELRRDDMWVTQTDKLGVSDSKIPYGELESVDKSECCCCFHGVNDFAPGWCGLGQEAAVSKIADALEARRVQRGQLAQYQQLRAARLASLAIDLKTGALLRGQGEAEGVTNARTLRPKAMVDDSLQGDLPELEHDVTNKLESVLILLFSLGTAGWRSRKLLLNDREVVEEVTDRCGYSRSRTSYALLGGIDMDTFCCCCHGIGGVACPGWGCCNEAAVEKVFADLHDRYLRRGQTAQLMLQSQTIDDVLCAEAKLDVLAARKGVAYPPAQEAAEALFEAPLHKPVED